MPKVLVVTSQNDTPWFGSYHRLIRTIESLCAMGCDIEVLGPASLRGVLPKGCVFHNIGTENILGASARLPSLRHELANLAIFAKTVRLIQRSNYDIIHTFDDGATSVYYATRIRRIPYVIDRRSDYLDVDRGGSTFWKWMHGRFERHTLKHAEAVIGNHPAVIRRMDELHRRSRACIIYDIPALPANIPEAMLKSARAKYRTSPENPLITCVGGLDRFQGLGVLFNAMPHVLIKKPNAKFAIVGGSKSEIVKMSKAVKKARIGGAVIFTGRLPAEELSALLRVSDILVSPRRKGDSAPVRVLDYLNANKPVVAADTPANRAILNPDNAILTPPNPRSLAEGILKICISPETGTKLARQGKSSLRRAGRTAEDFLGNLRLCYQYALRNRR